MKETPVSNIEQTFLLESLYEGKRIDGRSLEERRTLELKFGRDYGNCLVTLGNTRVLATVTASVAEPTPSRPCEGILLIFLEYLQMCAPRFSDARTGSSDDESTETVRVIERCLKESKCLDMESLCIVAEEKVWTIRLELKVLNHEGSVADCASVAGLAALAHFRRPDVTLQGDIVQIHPVNEKDPVPLAVHHYPVCSTFAFFNMAGKSDRVIATDPNHQEESIMSGKLVLGVNPYREICTLHLAGQMLIDKNTILRLSHRAAQYSKETVNKIKAALAVDQENRAKGVEVGLGKVPAAKSILANHEEKTFFDLDKLMKANAIESVEDAEAQNDTSPDMEVVEVDDGLVELTDKSKNAEAIEYQRALDRKRKEEKMKEVEEIVLDSESEEDDCVIVAGKDL